MSIHDFLIICGLGLIPLATMVAGELIKIIFIKLKKRVDK